MKNLFIILLVILAAGATGYFVKEKTLEDGQKESTSVSSGDSVVNSIRGVLDLHGQGLTKAPAYIFDRTDITELDLSHNSLEGALQAEVRHLQNLKVLDLSDNKFTVVPAEIGQLKDLEVLDLSNNLLTGLPYELGNLSKLKLLDLSGNEYSEMDLLNIRKRLPSSAVIKSN